MKAYILSEKNGTVQIGDTVFAIFARTCFRTNRKGLKKYPSTDVPKKDMKSAEEAMTCVKEVK